MHPSISVNTLSLAPAPLGQQIDVIARLGASALSPDLDQVGAFGVAATTRAVADAGLAVATLTHRAFAYATPDEMETGRERLMRTIDVAEKIGADSVIMTTGGRGALTWTQAAEHFVQGIAPCAEAARSAGIALGIEPTSHLYADVSIAHRLSDAVTLARAAGICVMIDLFACWTDADIDTAIDHAGPLIALVQVSDYVFGDRGLPCRAVPGDGAVPLERLISGVCRTGFTGWFDLEIIGPRLQAEGEDAGLRRAMQVIGNLLEIAK